MFARSLMPIISAFAVTAIICPVSAAPAASRPADSNHAAASRPSEAAGSVNQALTELYRIPRNNRPPGVKRNTNAAPSVKNEGNRLGLQHADAIRNSVSSLPIDDDLHRSNGNSNTVTGNGSTAPTGGNDPAAAAWEPYFDPFYPQRRLPDNVRDWTDYRYFDGEPSRFGHGRYNRMYGIGNSPQGEYFRFGFLEGYEQGQFDREGNERTQSLLTQASTHMGRGLAAFRNGQYREAVKHFKLASETNQGDPSAMIYTAHALFAIGRYQEGSAYLRKAFTLEPRIALLTYDMRDDYGNRQDFTEQFTALHSALKAAPTNVDRLAMFSYVLNFSGRTDDAYKLLAKARKIGPNDKIITLLYEASNPPDPK